VIHLFEIAWQSVSVDFAKGVHPVKNVHLLLTHAQPEVFGQSVSEKLSQY
jgi:hypothetical protein